MERLPHGLSLHFAVCCKPDAPPERCFFMMIPFAGEMVCDYRDGLY
jgi:hypothetical protein